MFYTPTAEDGIFAIKGPDGVLRWDSFRPTAERSRDYWLAQCFEGTWEEGVKAGFSVVRLREDGQALPVLTTQSSGLTIPKTADSWDLYASNPGAEEAAQALGAKLEELVLAARSSNCCTVDEARRIRDLMYIEMGKYVQLGACDTEPQTILVCRIESALGLPESLSR